MNESENNRIFKLSLHQEDILLCERCMDANVISNYSRLSINIRDVLPELISRIQKVLSKKSYDTTISLGNGKYIDAYDYMLNMVQLYPNHMQSEMVYNPKVHSKIVQDKDGNDKLIKGVECKIGLYNNEKPIIERIFYVHDFNPISRWSIDLIDTFNSISRVIFNDILVKDNFNIQSNQSHFSFIEQVN